MVKFSRRHLYTLVAAALLSGGCDDKTSDDKTSDRKASDDKTSDARTTTVYLVRHAEKANDATQPADPELSAAGKARAEALPDALGQTKLAAVFSSQFRRTQQTVAPAAKAQGLEVQTVDAADVKALVAKLNALEGGDAALVAGHSNTVPPIIEALGVAEKVQLGEDDYGDLFVVTIGSNVQLERRRFGR